MNLLTTILILSTCFHAAQNDKLCSNHPQQLLNQRGKPVRLSAKETKIRAVHCETPKLPGLVDAQGSIIVEILINPEGKVECARALNGHPILKKIALETAMKWRFKPVEEDGKPVAVYGLITMHMHWDSEIAKKTCQR